MRANSARFSANCRLTMPAHRELGGLVRYFWGELGLGMDHGGGIRFIRFDFWWGRRGSCLENYLRLLSFGEMREKEFFGKMALSVLFEMNFFRKMRKMRKSFWFGEFLFEMVNFFQRIGKMRKNFWFGEFLFEMVNFFKKCKRWELLFEMVNFFRE